MVLKYLKYAVFFQSYVLGEEAVSTSPEASLAFQLQCESPVLGRPHCIVYNRGAHAIAWKVREWTE